MAVSSGSPTAELFDVPLAFLFRTLAIVNLGVFVITTTAPCWWGRRSAYSSHQTSTAAS